MTNERTPLLRPPSTSSSNIVINPALTGEDDIVARDPLFPDASALAAESVGVDGIGPSPAHAQEDKLPILQMTILGLCRLVESVMFFVILPFISEMIQSVGGIEEERVGFWAGLIESLFSLTQIFVMIPWARLSDRMGRKPVLVLSMLGLSASQFCFGLSQDVKGMILWRCSAGIFAGTAVTVRTMVTEISTPTTQARAFSLWAFAGNVGITIGPLIGGTLADAGTTIGGPFAKIPLINDNPYALPCFVAGGLGFICTLLSFFFLDETLKKTKKEETDKKRGDSTSVWNLVKQPGVAHVLGLQVNILVVAFAYTAVLPVFWFTSVNLGGFGFTPAQISALLSFSGACQAVYLLLLFPILQRRRGTGFVLLISSYIYMSAFFLPPFLNFLLRTDHQTAFRALIFPVLMFTTAASMEFTAIQLAINDVCPDPALMGTLNGLVLSLASGTRAVCPAIFSTIFAWGVEHQILKGYLIWSVLAIIGTIQVFNVGYLHPRANGEKDKVSKVTDEEFRRTSSSPEDV